MEKEDIIYQLTIEDIQNVSNEQYNIDLTQEQIKKVIEYIEDNINWYEVIANGISGAL